MALLPCTSYIGVKYQEDNCKWVSFSEDTLIGLFSTPLEAAIAYDEHVVVGNLSTDHHPLNFPTAIEVKPKTIFEHSSENKKPKVSNKI